MDNRLKRSILIIEDNELNREMLKAILETDYYIVEAADGEEGLKILKKHYKDLSLVLLDVQMPRMNGYEFLEKYSADSLISAVPVIVTTGSSISDDEERCLAMGASDFVTKPYNPRIILRRIEAIIRLTESLTTLKEVEYDTLTGLYTRSAFYHYAKERLRHSIKDQDMVLINVEGFSYINERYGEAMGDELLIHIGKKMRELNTHNSTFCRYHADRFAVIYDRDDTGHNENITRFISYVHEGAPLDEFTVKISVYEKVPRDLPVSVLCDRLAMALDRIRHQYNTDVCYYTKEMTEALKRKHRIEETMEDGITNNEFKIYYQPKHDAQTGAIVGAEALVRWQHPEFGLLPPIQFIPLFEENGFISHLDFHIWERVCKTMRSWADEGITPVPVSVNASRRDFLAVDDKNKILDVITKYGLDKRNLHIEITESLGIEDGMISRKIKALHDMGITVELDDFGAGQSSLSALRNIPMDIVKLDMSFIKELDKQKEIVGMIISLVHALGHKTVAEGVETGKQLDMLRELGCDMIQGYYYSKPLPEEEFKKYLKYWGGDFKWPKKLFTIG